jgi:5-methylcytosine-specific restriction protein B
MSRIKNLYTYLITNRRADVDGWLEDYCIFTSDVATVREALNRGKGIEETATFERSSFAAVGWPAFARRLLFEKDNGISSRGQSVLSGENFDRFIKEPAFVTALTELIKAPTKESFTSYAAAWEDARQKHGGKRNPLLVNRTLAACTTKVSSTVNGAAFASVYQWLVNEGFCTELQGADWYDRNVQVMEILRTEFAEELEKSRKGEGGGTSEQLLSIFVWYLYENISNPFMLKKQVIKYGAPGTGKTYTAKLNTRLLFAIWQEKYGSDHPGLTYEECRDVVQFHPSYGYEDFIEGLRPVLTPDGQSRLMLQNGVFKQFCQRAGHWEIEVHNIPAIGPKLAEQWATLTVGQLRPYFAYQLKHPSWERISQRNDAEKIADIVPPFFFIIDEINRAELSRVLGELMFCMEYRGVEGAISTQYASMNTKETAMLQTKSGLKFFIPHNVYIIGTMNTIDRSVESFDLALRRRFRWEQIVPNITALRYHLRERDAQPGNRSHPWGGLADDLESLNRRIRETDILGTDYEIGHAYLMNLRYPPTLTRNDVRETVWEDAIKPLLEEYLRGSGRAETLIPEFQKSFGIA